MFETLMLPFTSGSSHVPLLNLHRINVLTKLLRIIGVTCDVIGQPRFRFLHSSDIGEEIERATGQYNSCSQTSRKPMSQSGGK
jgi:hypothetical protein